MILKEFTLYFFVWKPGKKNYQHRVQKKKIIFAHFVVGNTSRFELSSLLFIHLGMVKMIQLIAVYSLTLNDDPPPPTPLTHQKYIKEVCSVRYGGMDIILKLLFFSILKVAILFVLFTWVIINLAFPKKGVSHLSLVNLIFWLDRNYLFRYKIIIFTLLIYDEW